MQRNKLRRFRIPVAPRHSFICEVGFSECKKVRRRMGKDKGEFLIRSKTHRISPAA